MLLRQLKYFYLNASIRRKLIIMQMLIALLTGVLFAVAFFSYGHNSVKEQLTQELRLLTEIIAKRTAPAIIFLNEDNAKENLEDLNTKESIVLSCIFLEGGALLAQYNSKDSGPTCPKNPPDFGYFFHSGNLIVHEKIKGNQSGDTMGSIYVVSDMREMEEHVVRLGWLSSTVMVGVFSLTLFIANLLQSPISNPIISLYKITRKLHRSSDYSIRAEKFYDDETGTLTTTFNDMMAGIQESKENLEGLVKERTSDLEKALTVKSDFLANMSHEIRTPIHAIKNYIDIILDEWEESPDEEKRKFLTRVLEASGRLDLLINNLLDLSKLERGGMILNITQEKLSDIVQSVIGEIQPELDNKSIKVECCYPENEPVAELDRTRIGQVVTNLFTNALRYGKNSNLIAKVKTEALHQEDAVLFSLKDQGLGVPDGELESIFEVNVQSSNTKTSAGGTGLGLAISKQIMEVHGGNIWAENNDDGGATFSFALPVKSQYGGADNG